MARGSLGGTWPLQTGLNHIGFNYNPCGHPPLGVFTEPHYDAHFYYITPAERGTAPGEAPCGPRWRGPCDHRHLHAAYVQRRSPARSHPRPRCALIMRTTPPSSTTPRPTSLWASCPIPFRACRGRSALTMPSPTDGWIRPPESARAHEK
eukprot:scaffold497_cov368-Prasinococcus_capsulatus_cf.AAC.19